MSLGFEKTYFKWIFTAALANFSIGEFRNRTAVMIAPALSPNTVTLIFKFLLEDIIRSVDVICLRLVAPKETNIILYPLQSGELILKRQVKRATIIG